MNIDIQLNESYDSSNTNTKFRFYWNLIIMMLKSSLVFKYIKLSCKKSRYQHFIALVMVHSCNYLNRCSVRIFIQLQNVFCKYTSTEI